MRYLNVIILVLLFNLPLLAEGNGGYAGAFLRLGLGARGMAMGNAQTATGSDGFGFYYNPAGLPFLGKFSANLSYSFMSLDRRLNYVGLSTPLKPNAGFSIGWIYSGVGEIEGYNSVGQSTGNINHGLHAIYFSFGVAVIPGRLAVGVSAKYLAEKISDEDDSYDYSGTGLGGDLGAYFKATEWLQIGYQLKDINAAMKSNTDKIYDRGMQLDNQFPVSNRLGVFVLLPVNGLGVAYDFEWSDAGEEKNHIGLEYRLPHVAGRIGYDNDKLTVGGGLDFSTGLGIQAILNYAFINSAIDEGVSHVFTWEFAL